MRASRGRSLAGTLALTAVLLVTIGSLWPFVASFYDDALVAILQPVTPSGIRLAGETPAIVFYREPGGFEQYRTSSLVLHLALILCVSVVLATPRMRWPPRLGWGAGTGVAIVLSHMVVLTYVTHAVAAGSTGQLPAVYAVYWSVFPAVIAGLWCYLRWVPRWRESGP